MLEILKDGLVIATIPPGGRFRHPDTGDLHYNVKLETELQGLVVREYVAAEPEPGPVAPSDIDIERIRRTLAGHHVAVTGYGDIPLQGRPEDQINYLGLKDTASDLKAAGYTAPIIPFRDAANVVHMLTPDQMIEAVNKGKEHVSALYQAAWALKEMDPIPADYATNDAYWP